MANRFPAKVDLRIDDFRSFLRRNMKTSFWVANNSLCPLAIFLRENMEQYRVQIDHDVLRLIDAEEYARDYHVPAWAKKFMAEFDQKQIKTLDKISPKATGRQALNILKKIAPDS